MLQHPTRDTDTDADTDLEGGEEVGKEALVEERPVHVLPQHGQGLDGRLIDLFCWGGGEEGWVDWIWIWVWVGALIGFGVRRRGGNTNKRGGASARPPSLPSLPLDGLWLARSLNFNSLPCARASCRPRAAAAARGGRCPVVIIIVVAYSCGGGGRFLADRVWY